MSKILSFFVIVLFTFSTSLFSQNVKAYINYNEFYSPKDGPFIETYMSIEGRSLEWKSINNGKMISQAELTIIFRKDSQIVEFAKDLITSPIINDSSEMNSNFMHINRFVLDTGRYDVSIKLDDVNDTLKAFFTTTSITINSVLDSIFISSIEVFKSKTRDEINADSFSKSGYTFVPNIYNFLAIQDTVINFYVEIYNTEKILGKETIYLFTYSILNSETKIPLSKYSKYKRLTAKPVQSIIGNFDIKTLPSNNFNLRLEIRDKKNNLRAEKEYHFQKQNTVIPIDLNDIASVNISTTFAELITSIDTLRDVIRSFSAISSPQESAFAENIVNNDDKFIMQQYIYRFWEKRSPKNPFSGFKSYMEEVRIVDALYGGYLHKGYFTDRGNIYLKYGKPNSVAKDYNDPAAYPYEIWHYYQTKNQSNVKFVFYNSDFASKDFRLLHSTAIGEVNNYSWRLQLRKRDRGFQSIDDIGNENDDWGSNINRYYENPR